VNDWSELVAGALVGTDRRGVAEPGDVLDRAAAWSVYRRAGWRPGRDLPAPRPAPPETGPVVSDAAAERLAGFLDPMSRLDSETRAALATEWLTAVVDRGLRAPAPLLPELLEAGRRDAALRPLILAVGGARATWLAAQRPEWTYLTRVGEEAGPADPATWWEGTTGQRVRYLTALRRSDPEAGRALLAGEWAALAPDERQSLLGALAVGLEPPDEDLLEAALDDRRAQVRARAADLLAALPGSRYAARMVARARAGLAVVGDRLVVSAPEVCGPDLRRDGIVARPPTGTGERAWWLRQILACTPLHALPEPDPARFLALRVSDGWAEPVRAGVAEAAARQRDHAWAAALLDELEGPDAARSLVEPLYQALHPDEAVRRAVAALSAEPVERTGRLVESLLPHCRPPWPDDLAAATLAAFARGARPWFPLRRVAHLAGLRAPTAFAGPAAALAERLAAAGPDGPADRARAGQQVATMLRLRHEMIQELT
jgi:hypothetical protein